MTLIHRKRLTIALLSAAISSPVMAADSEVAANAIRINAANELVRKGKFDDAVSNYREIKPTKQTKDDLAYNLAVAQYRRGDIAAAKTLFTEASASSQTSLATASRFNLGNCFYADAVASAEKNKSAAIESLQQAIEHYRGSLAGNPNHSDARANIELAAEFLKKLKQEQEQQQQQQQQQQDQDQDQQQQNQGQANQDKQEQGSESKDSQSKDNQSQEQKSEPEQARPEQQQSGSEEKKSEQEPSQDAGGQPQESNDESGKDTQENQPQPDQSAQEQAAKKPSPAQQQAQQQQAQQQAGEQQQSAESGEEEQAQTHDQPVPSGELKAASEQESNDKPNGRIAMADPNAKDAPMSKVEALKMLQAVRDRDMLRRLHQEQIDRNRHIPTDKDW